MLALIIIPIVAVCISFMLWYKYGRDEKPVETVEFYPPKGFNSAQVGAIYYGQVRDKHIISILFALANKGYIKIIPGEKKDDYRYIKIKDYDGDDKYEDYFMEQFFIKKKNISGWQMLKNVHKGMVEKNKTVLNEQDIEEINSVNFEKTDEVTPKDLKYRFYKIINDIKGAMKDELTGPLYVTKNNKYSWILALLSTLMLIYNPLFLLPQNHSKDVMIILSTMAVLGLGFHATVLFTITKKTARLFTAVWMIFMMAFIFIPVHEMKPGFNTDVIINLVVTYIAYVVICIFYNLIRVDTPEKIALLGKIKGFKTFIENVETDRLLQLLEENPNYTSEIMPYAYVLEDADKIAKKMSDNVLTVPEWYITDNKSPYSFSDFVNVGFKSTEKNMMAYDNKKSTR